MAFEILGTHDRADAAAGQGAALVEDAGHVAPRFAGRADDQRLAITAVFLPDQLRRLRDRRAPQVVRGLDGDLVLLDDDQQRALRPAGDDQGIIAGVLEHLAPVAAAVGVEIGVGWPGFSWSRRNGRRWAPWCPVSGPVWKMRWLSGPSGSGMAACSWYSSQAPSPLPPTSSGICRREAASSYRPGGQVDAQYFVTVSAFG